MSIVVRHIPFDTERYPLAREGAKALGCTSLERLADEQLERKRSLGERPRLTYQDNLRLRAVLASLPLDHPLMVVYKRLVTEVVAPWFGGRISYTQSPTFRVHMAGTPSVSDWHRDADVTRRVDYLTGWAPFVDTYDENALWVEQTYGGADYAPIPVVYGEVLIFDGALLRHGSQANTTPTSRVSLDFRFAAKAGSHDHGIFSPRPPPPYELVIVR